jgi:hypothetical protein
MSITARKQRRVNRELAHLRAQYPTPDSRLTGAIFGDDLAYRLGRLEIAARQGHDYHPMGAGPVQDWIAGYDDLSYGALVPRGSTEHEELRAGGRA